MKSVDIGEDIEAHVDVDSVLKYLAIQTMTVNFDGLTGRNEHNYFLYENNGKIRLIPWDYNLSWGGYVDFGEEEMFYEDGLESEEELDKSQWEAQWEEWYNNLSAEEKQKCRKQKKQLWRQCRLW